MPSQPLTLHKGTLLSCFGWFSVFFQGFRIFDEVKLLPDPQREVIELVFNSGMTHVEVSKHLGISIGTAKSRIRYAYQRLRENLGSNPKQVHDI